MSRFLSGWAPVRRAMMFSSSKFVFLFFTLLDLLLLADHVQCEDMGEIGENELNAMSSLMMSAKHKYYEILARLEDEDEEAPPGPPGGWAHTSPFSTTPAQQQEYNHFIEESMYVQYQDQFFAAYGGKDARGIHFGEIARPEGSTTGYYTGVTHFQHVNNPHLVTFLFSAGRHDGGANTYLTIDTSDEDPFVGALESFIKEEDVSTWTWVSTYTVGGGDGPVHHYALFSGGNGKIDGVNVVGPSKLYIFEEMPDGTLNHPPIEAWVEDLDDISGPARHCLLADLGDIYDNDTGTQTSIQGLPDIIITGAGGLDVYSTLGNLQWQRVRSISIEDSNDDTAAFAGVEVVGSYLIITARAAWRTNAGEEFEAPCLVYDYQKDEIVQQFSSMGQTVSVAVLDEESRVLIGAGGQAGYTGQPNLMFDVHYKEEEEDNHGARLLSGSKTKKKKKLGKIHKLSKSDKGRSKSSKTCKSKKPLSHVGTLSLKISDPQLSPGMPLNYTIFDRVDRFPVSSEEYFVVPSPGKTKTRQVLPFRINKNLCIEHEVDLVLEINSGQTCNIYYRASEDEPAYKVMPLPRSEGFVDQFTSSYARAGDTLLVGDQLYIIIAQFNGNNTVYSFSTEVF